MKKFILITMAVLAICLQACTAKQVTPTPTPCPKGFTDYSDFCIKFTVLEVNLQKRSDGSYVNIDSIENTVTVSIIARSELDLSGLNGGSFEVNGTAQTVWSITNVYLGQELVFDFVPGSNHGQISIKPTGDTK